LGQLGVSFEVAPSGIDETALPGETPEGHARRLAAAKAAEVAQRLGADHAGAFVLAADTIVVIDGQVLGKPVDAQDAVRMLCLLRGRTHCVITAVSLRQVGSDYRDDAALFTDVTFRTLDDAMAAAYVASGEGSDKAGSYAIQGIGAGMVAAVSGSYTNVVGLPAVETVDMLLRAGVLSSWP
jgi:septum formation protein